MIYIDILDTTFFTNKDKTEVLGICYDAVNDINSTTKSDAIQFVCDILQCNAEEHNGNYYEWVK